MKLMAKSRSSYNRKKLHSATFEASSSWSAPDFSFAEIRNLQEAAGMQDFVALL